jgi:hypothetical protein
MEVVRSTKLVQCVPAQSISGAAVNGAAVDTQNYGEAIFILNVGTVLASGTLDVKIQESVDSGFTSPTDVASAVFTQVTPANDVASYVGKVQTIGRQQYLRTVHTAAVAASTSGSDCILANPIFKPAQTPAFAV